MRKSKFRERIASSFVHSDIAKFKETFVKILWIVNYRFHGKHIHKEFTMFVKA